MWAAFHVQGRQAVREAFDAILLSPSSYGGFLYPAKRKFISKRWKCVICEFPNPPQNTACVRCGAQRAVPRDLIASARASWLDRLEHDQDPLPDRTDENIRLKWWQGWRQGHLPEEDVNFPRL